MKRSITICVLLMALYSVVMAETKDEVPASPSGNTAQPATAAAQTKPAASTAKQDKEFRPSETISADSAVSFPADI